MKKLALLFVAAALTLAACNNDTAQKNDKEQEQAEKVTQGEEVANAPDKTDDQSHHDGEPNEHSECAFCNMKVYMKDEEMGAFTAKAITDDEETLFFDDVGCLLNYDRDHEDVVLKEKLVRDYNSLDWVALEDAKIVHADIETPMKYGNAFFADTASLETFMNDFPDAKETTVQSIDDVAKERYMKKMEMKDGDHHDHSHSEDEESGHEGH